MEINNLIYKKNNENFFYDLIKLFDIECELEIFLSFVETL